MSQPYVGEIRMFAGNFAPQGWMLCQGQTLAISEYDVLFQLIGTTYGGDGQTTFNLPDLRSRVPCHQGSGFAIGQHGGEEVVTLTVQQIPQHTHPMLCNSSSSSSPTPAGSYWGAANDNSFIVGTSANAAMNAAAISPTGGSQPHDNLMPYLTINYIISLFGIFPSPT
jgi:microcystin-dependent protein